MRALASRTTRQTASPWLEWAASPPWCAGGVWVGAAVGRPCWCRRWAAASRCAAAGGCRAASALRARTGTLTEPLLSVHPRGPLPQGFDLLSWLLSRFIPPVFMAAFHGPALVFMFIYLWSKQNANAPVGWPWGCAVSREAVRGPAGISGEPAGEIWVQTPQPTIPTPHHRSRCLALRPCRPPPPCHSFPPACHAPAPVTSPACHPPAPVLRRSRYLASCSCRAATCPLPSWSWTCSWAKTSGPM